MSTHRRAWLVRAALMLVVAAAGTVGLASPAQADDSIDVAVIAPPNTFGPGDSQQLQVQVTNKTTNDEQVTVSVNVDPDFTVGNPQGCSASGQGACTLTVTKSAQATVSFTITAKATVDVPSGQTAQKMGSAKAATFGHSAEADFQMNLSGPAQAASVPSLSGVVYDIFAGSGKKIVNARVAAQDSANPPHTWTVGTDSNGVFKITSTPQTPIAPGVIAFVVSKDGYQDFRQTVNAVAGQAQNNLQFAMTPVASSASASASLPAQSSAPVSSIENGNTLNTSGNGSGGGLSWVLIAIGAILVALGVGAIVILLVRRKGDNDEDEDEAGGRGPRGGGPGGRGGRGRPPYPQGGRRPPEPTTVMRGGPGGRPGGPGGPRGDQTMIARSPLADMPTQMHRPVSGPQGGPPPAGYGQNPYASNQYGGGGAGGGHSQYPGGAPPNYGQPDPYGNAYGPQQHQGGYGGGPQQGGYDQGGYDQGGNRRPNEHDQRGSRPGPPDRRVDWLED